MCKHLHLIYSIDGKQKQQYRIYFYLVKFQMVIFDWCQSHLKHFHWEMCTFDSVLKVLAIVFFFLLPSCCFCFVSPSSKCSNLVCSISYFIYANVCINYGRLWSNENLIRCALQIHALKIIILNWSLQKIYAFCRTNPTQMDSNKIWIEIPFRLSRKMK